MSYSCRSSEPNACPAHDRSDGPRTPHLLAGWSSARAARHPALVTALLLAGVTLLPAQRRQQEAVFRDVSTIKANLYEGGHIRDEKKLFESARRLANRGEPGAMHAVAVLYSEGRGTPADKRKAAKWFKKAADKGFAPSRFVYGLMQMSGYGTTQRAGRGKRDATRALRDIRREARKGDKDARQAVKDLKPYFKHVTP